MIQADEAVLASFLPHSFMRLEPIKFQLPSSPFLWQMRFTPRREQISAFISLLDLVALFNISIEEVPTCR